MESILGTIFLGGCTYTDVREKRIDIRWCIGIAGIIAVYLISLEKWNEKERIWGLLLGGIMCLLSYISNNEIGMGDSIMILILGELYGIFYLIEMLLITFGMLSVLSIGILLLKKGNRKTQIAVAPFLFAANVGLQILSRV